ncbi:hypothetical protein [Paenibacillus glacialis]|uniref:Transposase n=1 Tax=Paenibacillus glacialis TaxID=494026 RepID=A0A162LY37_9BACL|nr:hypothetical protein PGLA_15200 [Paenibacillus glacialis]
MKHNYSIVMLCEIAEVSRAGFNKWKANIDSRKARREKDSQLKDHILAIHRLRPFFGRKVSVIFPNILNREFTASRARTKLVTDITYVRIGHDFGSL